MKLDPDRERENFDFEKDVDASGLLEKFNGLYEFCEKNGINFSFGMQFSQNDRRRGRRAGSRAAYRAGRSRVISSKESPSNEGLFTTEVIMFDNTSKYEEEIAPLVTTLHEKCQSAGMPFLFTAMTLQNEQGTGHAVTCYYDSEKAPQIVGFMMRACEGVGSELVQYLRNPGDEDKSKDFDLLSFFEKEIQPLAKQVSETCEKNGIEYFFCFCAGCDSKSYKMLSSWRCMESESSPMVFKVFGAATIGGKPAFNDCASMLEFVPESFWWLSKEEIEERMGITVEVKKTTEVLH